MSGWYNGYSPKERGAKSAWRRAGKVKLTPAKPPCELCGDPGTKVRYHSEDYSLPYLWDAPAVYALCRPCHSRLHKRFDTPGSWEAFKAFLRRGYYAREATSKRLDKLQRLGSKYAWPEVSRRVRPRLADPWWERLTTDRRSLRARWARPRYDEESPAKKKRRRTRKRRR